MAKMKVETIQKKLDDAIAERFLCHELLTAVDKYGLKTRVSHAVRASCRAAQPLIEARIVRYRALLEQRTAQQTG